jgi:alkylation response protein AidB-like acyl-CoA dehydrogenase
MDFSFTEEQEMWRRTMEEFTEKEAGREYTRMCDLQARYPQELWDAGVKQGFLGLLIPPEYGGMGADAIMFTIFVECLAKYSYEMASVFHVPMFSATNIVEFGTEEQKRKYLPAFIRGEQRFSISMTEPEAGSDASAIVTSAVLQGDFFVLNGKKQFSTGAHLPNNIMVMSVRTDKNAVPPRKGISVILVPNNLPGVECRVLPLIARRAVGTCSVFLSDVKVPRENLLGKLNGGWEILTSHLEWERLAVCAACCGESKSTLDDIMEYTKKRVQFGQAISRFQDVGHRLADLWCELQAARALTYQVAWMITSKIPCLKEVSAAKILTTQLLHRCALAGMQFMGGYSLLPESDFERHWRNARYLLVGGGATEVQRYILTRLLGLR